MINLAQKLFSYLFLFILVAVAAFVNWWQPIYLWLGDTPIYRFIWLGIFFVLIDIAIEIIVRATKQLGVIGEMMSIGKDIRKISGGFRVVSKVSLSNNLKADYAVIGSSGIWLLNVRDNGGKITFNGDDIVQNERILKGLLSEALEKSYALANFIKDKIGRDFIITPVITFSGLKADFVEMPKAVRGVYVVPRKDIVSLIENTDIQLIDQKTIEDIYKILKK